VLRHDSSSGMYRAIALFVLRDGDARRITWQAAKLLEGYDDRHDAARAGGCGVDMGFPPLYNLSATLYPEYKCIGEGKGKRSRCPSNFHQGENWDVFKRGMKHSDGYALSQRWL